MAGNDLQDQVVLVTGGTQGIGKGIAMHLLGKGMRVAIMDVDKEAGNQFLERLESEKQLLFIHGNTSRESDVKKAVFAIKEHFGSLHGLVNNAGISNAFGTPLSELTLDDWNRILSTNLTGYFLTTKHCVPMIQMNQGSVVNISSTRSLQSESNSEAYAASKGGVLSLTHALAMSLGPGIRVNAISPGWIPVGPWKKNPRQDNISQEEHEQHPCGRAGKVSDIAEMTAFLLSEKSGFITGQNFVIDGGMTKKMIYK